MDAVEFTTTVKDGKIEIPEPYRERFKSSVHVVLSVEVDTGGTDMIRYLMKHPLKVTDPRPLSRDEAHARK